MNPNSISHRLFAAALSAEAAARQKRPSRSDRQPPAKLAPQSAALPPLRPAAEWGWSGWQHRTI